MRIRHILMSSFLLALWPAAESWADGPLVSLAGGEQSMAMSAAEIQAGQEARLTAAMPEPVSFTLRRAAPNGTELSAVYGEAGENLLATIPPGLAGFDEHGELAENFSLQVAVRDLDGDKIPEFLLATGNGASTLTAAVFVYDAKGAERFRSIGVIEGQSSLSIGEDGRLTVPFGLRGLLDEYAISGGRLLKKEWQ